MIHTVFLVIHLSDILLHHFHIVDCVFVWGDAEGGSEKKVGMTSSEEDCAKMVTSMEPTANGATWKIGYQGNPVMGKCFAEFYAITIQSGLKCTFPYGKCRACIFPSRFISSQNTERIIPCSADVSFIPFLIIVLICIFG